MAVLLKIFELFGAAQTRVQEAVKPSTETVYQIKPLTDRQLEEVWRLNQRCFNPGENYQQNTFSYLLSDASTLSYRAVDRHGNLVGFIFVSLTDDGAGHITTIGIAPEHRRRRLAEKLILHIENALRARSVNSIFLEVRAGNTAALNLYRKLGFYIIQTLEKYYADGEDGLLMIKSLN